MTWWRTRRGRRERRGGQRGTRKEYGGVQVLFSTSSLTSLSYVGRNQVEAGE